MSASRHASRSSSPIRTRNMVLGLQDARTVTLWAAPPVMVVGSAAFTSTVIADSAGLASNPEMFWVSTLTGAVGYATHWAVSRVRAR